MSTINENMISFSVVICTWNRHALLRQTLEGMTRVLIPSGIRWELLVVNNNSTDATDEVIASFSDRLPIRALFEPKPGLSNARNHALSEARGSYIFWTDDDVLVDREWMQNYLMALKEWPNAVFFGGVIDPLFEVKPPLWIRRHLNENNNKIGLAFAIRNFGEEVRPFERNEVPFGANMVFRADILRQFRFNPRLGRTEKGMLAGEEVEVIDRLRETGHYGVWVGNARVRHFIPARRLTKRFVWECVRGASRTQARLGAPNGHLEGPYIFNTPRWAIRRYVECSLKSLLCSPFKGRRWLRAFLEAAYWRGVIDESRQNRQIQQRLILL